MDYLELRVAVRREAAEAAADLLRAAAPAGVAIDEPCEAIDDEGGILLRDELPVTVRAWLPAGAAGRTAAAALRRELRKLGGALVQPPRTRTVSDASWREVWKRHFTPLRIGRRLVVRPPWRRGRTRRGDIVIEIDPGLAFGTGQHQTTRLCLEALEERLERGTVVLDVGPGSGILAIAAALLGARCVDALDIDPAAVRATKENARRNGVERLVRARRGSLGADWPFPTTADGRYNLVLANLSSRLVRELAGPIVGALVPGGVALASGLIAEQEASCRRALERAGGRVIETRRAGGWRLLAVERATDRRSRTSRAPGRPRRRAQ